MNSKKLNKFASAIGSSQSEITFQLVKDFPAITHKTDIELISLFKETENNLIIGELYKRHIRFAFAFG